MQRRAVSGVVFENSFQGDGWVRQSTSPKFRWLCKGRSIIDKIKSANYNPVEFILDETSPMSKYDIYNTITGKKREVKKYHLGRLNEWVLYSEPFFKIASKHTAGRIGVSVYNKFVEDYYEYYKNTGLFERVINKMTNDVEGVQIIDTFIPMNDLTFKVEILRDNWMGYHRLSVFFKLK